ncbi:MAG: hypothetical protein IT178_00575, partial [Acidobacteria bacterium]|nr:hypothetical protein [Acidobacteriota bacterium]
VYGRARDSARPGDRPLLHAWRLAFPHPLTGQRIAVEAPLPRDFHQAVRRLHRAANDVAPPRPRFNRPSIRPSGASPQRRRR